MAAAVPCDSENNHSIKSCTFSTVKDYHGRAFKAIDKALKIEESGGETSQALKYYRTGLNLLRYGAELRISDFKDVETVDRARRLQQKMKDNETRVADRVLILESQLKTNVAANDDAAASSAGVNRRKVSQSAKPVVQGRNKNTNSVSVKSKPAALISKSKPTSSTTECNMNEAPPVVRKERLRVSDLKNVDSKLAHLILDEIVQMPCDGQNLSLNDIIGHDTAKEALREAVLLPALRPDLFTGLRSPTRGLLLFGPPGNGKTLLAKAVCQEGGLVFFNISAASLTSKWVGESEKLVRALFAVATALQPAVIFIDEVDSVLCKRHEQENEAARRLKTQFLLELDGVRSAPSQGQCCRLLVMCATNRPWELDDAVLRRFGKKIYIDMPTCQARAHLLAQLINKVEGNALSEQQLQAIAEVTQGYSASDLTNLARDAAMAPLRQLNLAQLTSLPADRVRKLTPDDLYHAMRRVRPSVPVESLSHFITWNQAYGDISAMSHCSTAADA